jgi:hypothetical protein
MSQNKILHIVHCIDTEGPLMESLSDTFERVNNTFKLNLTPSSDILYKLQSMELDLAGREKAVATMVAPELLKYNQSWTDIEWMLEKLLSKEFRNDCQDDFGGGWVYSWHCMDHVGYSDNPRHKDIGYGNVFNFYENIIRETGSNEDELNWHFHPLSFNRNPLNCATSYTNNYDILVQILCRRIIEKSWFPEVNRPGFHAERSDSHRFLEDWIPFDYANQFYEMENDQPDLAGGRFGDWRRAPATWRGYNPAHDDYQAKGNCRRWIFRCLNVGTRHKLLMESHVNQALKEAEYYGEAVLAFTDHDYRDILVDVGYVKELIEKARTKYAEVKIKFSGAAKAARAMVSKQAGPRDNEIGLKIHFDGPMLIVEKTKGKVFGPQPFLAIKTITGNYFHDNFDFQEPGKLWTYTFDEHTLKKKMVEEIGVACAGRYGKICVKKLKIEKRE